MPFWLSERAITRQQAIDAIGDIVTHGVYRRELAIPDMPEPLSLAPPRARASFEQTSRQMRQDARSPRTVSTEGARPARRSRARRDAGMTRAGIYYFSERAPAAGLPAGAAGEVAIRDHLQEQNLGAFDNVQRLRLLLMLHNTRPKATYHNINYLNDVDRKAYVGQVLPRSGKARAAISAGSTRVASAASIHISPSVF